MNPIYTDDAEYRKSLETLPEHLRRAFLDGDWSVFAGQYFDIFDYGRHTARPEEIRLEPWWPRRISIDCGFQHPSAVHWHCAVPLQNWPMRRGPGPLRRSSADPTRGKLTARAVLQRNFTDQGSRAMEHALSRIGSLSRTAFRRACWRKPSQSAAADDDRVASWQFVYQLLENNAWVITENCDKLIACIPTLAQQRQRRGHPQDGWRRSRGFRAIWIGLRR